MTHRLFRRVRMRLPAAEYCSLAEHLVSRLVSPKVCVTVSAWAGGVASFTLERRSDWRLWAVDRNDPSQWFRANPHRDADESLIPPRLMARLKKDRLWWSEAGIWRRKRQEGTE